MPSTLIIWVIITILLLPVVVGLVVIISIWLYTYWRKKWKTDRKKRERID